MCCEAVKKLLKQDKQGQASLGTVKVISGLVKSRNYDVRPEILLYLRIKEVEAQTTQLPKITTKTKRRICLGCKGSDLSGKPSLHSDSLQHPLWSRKRVNLQRALAFVKRLSTLSLHTLPNTTVGILASNKIHVSTFPKCNILLDNEAQGSGVFLPELDEPEYCNPQSTALWELHTLRAPSGAV
ncbi:unnamed protein product [Oncorhynchus mykiss]|uniref:CCAAT-binding factor domain-containing protein n=1 Tax=Oncorhynchus mykiss TaxID=8022 RepID=A0A060WA37_ONCMY|nr:unnamed protein product [Oncorhynchus mykiss]